MTDRPTRRIPRLAEVLRDLTPEDIQWLQDVSAQFDLRAPSSRTPESDQEGGSELASPDTPAIKWHEMTDREQMVWAVTYAGCALDPASSVHRAEKAVLGLQALGIDESGFTEPEHEAARCCSGLAFEEFKSWYPTALKIATYNRRGYQEPDEAAIRAAYDRYRRSTNDYY